MLSIRGDHHARAAAASNRKRPSSMVTKVLILLTLSASALLAGWLFFFSSSLPPSASTVTPPAPHPRAIVSLPRPPAAPGDPPPAAAATPPEAELVPAEAGPQTSIHGRVTDTAGNPLSNTEVHAFGEGGYEAEARTDEAGEYALEWLAPNALYALRVSTSGYWPAKRLQVAVGLSAVDFMLEAAPLIAGKVLDRRTRQPVQQARISMGSDQGKGVAMEVLSNDTGEFEFEAPAVSYIQPDGAFLIEADGYLDQRQLLSDYFQRAEQEHRALYLDPMPQIVGFVRDAAGAAVANAQIYLPPGPSETNPGTFQNELVLAKTDQHGSYRISHLPSWPRSLYAHKEPQFAAAGSTLMPMNLSTEVQCDFMLQRGAQLDLTVITRGFTFDAPMVSLDYALKEPPVDSLDGVRASERGYWVFNERRGLYFYRGRPGMAKRVYNIFRSDPGIGSDPKAPQYQFAADGLPPGNADLCLKWPQGPHTSNRTVYQRLTMEEDKKTSLHLEMTSVAIKGHVISHWNGHASGSISAEYTDGSGLQQSVHAFINLDGSYQFETLPGVPLELKARIMSPGEFNASAVSHVVAPMTGALNHDIQLDQ